MRKDDKKRNTERIEQMRLRKFRLSEAKGERSGKRVVRSVPFLSLWIAYDCRARNSLVIMLRFGARHRKCGHLQTL